MERRKFIKTSAISSAALASTSLFSFASGEAPSPLPTIKDPRNLYGSLEVVMEGIRAHNPQDLSLPNWRKKNPQGRFEAWRSAARNCLKQGLNYDPGPLNLA